MATYATPVHPVETVLIRRPWDTGFTPFKRATTYSRIKNGTYPTPIKIGRMSAWVAGELASVNEALVQGRSDDQIRQLVADMVAARTAGVD